MIESIHIDNLVTILVNVHRCQFDKLSSRQFLISYSPPKPTCFVKGHVFFGCPFNTCIHVSYPNTCPYGEMVGFTTSFMVITSINPFISPLSLSYRKTILILIHPIEQCLRLHHHLLAVERVPPLRPRPPLLLLSQSEHQLVILIHVVIIVDDHAFANEMSVVVAALIPHAARNRPRKQSPLRSIVSPSLTE